MNNVVIMCYSKREGASSLERKDLSRLKLTLTDKMADKKILGDIYRLFDMAEKNPKMSKRYAQLAKKMAMRNMTKIPKELRRKFCSKCFSFFNSRNSETRIKKGFKIIKCLECGNYKRFKV